MAIYKKPNKKIHRGFFYLDDETVINSLSAVESGKIDEVVAKVNTAREGGFGAGFGVQGVKVEAGKKAMSGFEEEMVRTRTRFSIFELWYQTLIESKAIGTFADWGTDALIGVEAGDTVEFRAVLEVAPIQTLFRLFLWFAEQAKAQGTMFSQEGEELKSTKDAERTMRTLLGSEGDDRLTVIATPVGGPGPTVAMALAPDSLIGKVGRMGGEYTVIAQVNQIIAAGAEMPTLRLTQDVAATPLELNVLRESIQNFVDPARNMGVHLSGTEASIVGPALWIDPIAIYK